MPYVLVGSTRVPLPDTLPVAGQRLLVEVLENVVDSEGVECFATTSDRVFRIQLHWGSMEALLSTLQHELNEGVSNHCDLGLHHWQVSTLGEFGGPFWLAFLIAQNAK